MARILESVRSYRLVSLSIVTIVATAFVAPVLAGEPSTAGEPVSATAVAAQVDELIGQSLVDQGVAASPPASDEDFLRRASLDLTGRIPAREEVLAFIDDQSESKRADAIDRMVASEDFAATWASYWREVIYSRATDIRSRRTQSVFEQWMTEQLNSGRPWDAIVTDLLTATGNTAEDGSTALVFAHGGDATELAAETSRIFLGIQIQCANCHDHPYDSWKREDFHELAAFFPRIRVRREQEGKKRRFVVQSNDRGQANKGQGFDVTRVFERLDRDQDGELTAEEANRNKRFGKQIARLIKRGDKDGNGSLSLAEVKELPKRLANQGNRGGSEYFMPDLEDPTARGTRTQPVFFVNETTVPFGTKDIDRRTALAASIVSTDNEWFARAFVNRIWAELLGEGFYAPIDDMGPQRTAQLPQVLEVLAEGFVANGYDIKWLYRTIALTDAYQRTMSADASDADSPAFAAMSPTRLRGDQIYNSVTQALDVARFKRGGIIISRAKGMNGRTPGEALFVELFNYDPSTPQEDLMGNIPQALFMMNSPVTNAAINGRRGTVLAQTLKQFKDDREALDEVYLRVLSRQPTAEEADICRQHIAEIGDREEAFEDIMWSLLNSSEFLTKR